MSSFFEDLNLILQEGIKLPPGKEFDVRYTILNLSKPKNPIEVAVESFANAASLTPAKITFLKSKPEIVHVICFLYIYAHVLIIRELIEYRTDISFYFKTLFENDETLRDVFLAGGKTFFDRVTNLLAGKKNVFSSHRKEINLFFETQLVENYYRHYVCQLDGVPRYLFFNNLSFTNYPNSFIFNPVIFKLHEFKLKAQLDFMVKLYLYSTTKAGHVIQPLIYASAMSKTE